MGLLKRLFGKTHSGEISAFRVCDDGSVREVAVEAMLAREKEREKHERAVEVMDRGDYRTAIKAFKEVQRATEDDPEPMNWLNIAVCHAHLGEFRQSLAVLEDAMRRWPGNTRLRQNYEAIKRDASERRHI